jgi:glycosyltransferase involved in cell wall biosynthesis
MKVVQINSVCGIGSTGRIATDIHAALQSKGISSHIMYGRGDARACDSAIKIGTQLDFYNHALQTRLFDNHGFCSSKATRQALRKLDELQPDIVHLHNLHGYYLNVELLFDYFKKKTNLKVVWTLHDCWSFTGHCSHFDFVGCEKWKSQCFNCPQKKAYPSSKVLDNSKINFHRKKDAFTGLKDLTIVAPSNWLADLARQSYLKDYPIRVVKNGIDLNVFLPRESNLRQKYGLENKFIVLGVASEWSQRKGLKDFIKLSHKLPDHYRLVMVGLSRDIIEKLPANIVGIHRTDSPEALAELYSLADVFFNPTYEDNYPTVNLESIACGTPVITYDTGGSPESISSENGFVVAKGDIAGVLKIVKMLAEQPLSIRHVPASFNKNNFVNEILNFYGV